MEHEEVIMISSRFIHDVRSVEPLEFVAVIGKPSSVSGDQHQARVLVIRGSRATVSDASRWIQAPAYRWIDKRRGWMEMNSRGGMTGIGSGTMVRAQGSTDRKSSASRLLRPPSSDPEG